MVTTFIDEAGQSGTPEEQAYVVEVNVLQTVEVVIGTELSVGVVAGIVGDATVELYVTGRLLELVGATTIDEDLILEAELACSLVEGTEVVSALEAGVVDSALEYDSTVVAADDDAGATSLLVDGADVSATELVLTLEAADEEDTGATSLVLTTADDEASDDEASAVEEVSADAG